MTELAAGVRFAGYELEELAGRGGMGVVYRATDLALGRTVALKFISPELASNAAFRRRFEAESKTAASLDHPNVIPIFQAGEHLDMLFLAMRFVDGVDLEHVVAGEGPLPAARAVHVTAQVASALDAAHAAGLVHRDVKPANILLAANDHAYLTDFGLSKRLLAELGETETGTGQLLGTLDYVTPEQIRGTPVGPYTDVYALGCVLFFLLTGRVPFPMREREAKLWAHLSSPPPPVGPGVPEAFDAVISRAMAREPEQRFASAGDLASAAGAAAGTPDRHRSPAANAASSPVAAPASEPPRDLRWAWLRHALLSRFSLAVLAFVLVGGLIFGRASVAVPVAFGVYAIAAAVIYADRDERQRVRDREIARRRARAGSRLASP